MMQYEPTDELEQACYDALWSIAIHGSLNQGVPEVDAKLSGRGAFDFLMTSGLSRDELRQIWALADSMQRHFLQRPEFNVAVRLICLSANGKPLQELERLKGTTLPFPSSWEDQLKSVTSIVDSSGVVKPLFQKQDRVVHIRKSDGLVRHGIVVGVHTDDAVNGLYYTVRLDDGHELQASETKLRHEVEFMNHTVSTAPEIAKQQQEEMPTMQQQQVKEMPIIQQQELQKMPTRQQQAKEFPIMEQQEIQDPAVVVDWSLDPNVLPKYEMVFESVQQDGFVPVVSSVSFFQQSGLQEQLIHQILQMTDLDRDGCLSKVEFCMAFHIAVGIAKKGKPMPLQLPAELLQFHQVHAPPPAVPLAKEEPVNLVEEPTNDGDPFAALRPEPQQPKQDLDLYLGNDEGQEEQSNEDWGGIEATSQEQEQPDDFETAVAVQTHPEEEVSSQRQVEDNGLNFVEKQQDWGGFETAVAMQTQLNVEEGEVQGHKQVEDDDFNFADEQQSWGGFETATAVQTQVNVEKEEEEQGQKKQVEVEDDDFNLSDEEQNWGGFESAVQTQQSFEKVHDQKQDDFTFATQTPLDKEDEEDNWGGFEEAPKQEQQEQDWGGFETAAAPEQEQDWDSLENLPLPTQDITKDKVENEESTTEWGGFEGEVNHTSELKPDESSDWGDFEGVEETHQTNGFDSQQQETTEDVNKSSRNEVAILQVIEEERFDLLCQEDIDFDEAKSENTMTVAQGVQEIKDLINDAAGMRFGKMYGVSLEEKEKLCNACLDNSVEERKRLANILHDRKEAGLAHLNRIQQVVSNPKSVKRWVRLLDTIVKESDRCVKLLKSLEQARGSTDGENALNSKVLTSYVSDVNIMHDVGHMICLSAGYNLCQDLEAHGLRDAIERWKASSSTFDDTVERVDVTLHQTKLLEEISLDAKKDLNETVCGLTFLPIKFRPNCFYSGKQYISACLNLYLNRISESL